MNKYKTITVVLLVLFMALSVIGCSSDKSNVFDNGILSVTVPKGWMVYESKNSNNEVVKTNLSVVKTTDRSKIMDSPMVTISYAGSDKKLYPVTKNFYNDTKDLAPWEIGGKKFEGFKGTSFGAEMIYYFAVDGDKEYQVVIWPNMKNGTISLQDADVKAIVESLTGQ